MDRFASTSSDIALQATPTQQRVPGFAADGRPAPMETVRITERDGPRTKVVGEGDIFNHSKDHPSIHSQSALEVLGGPAPANDISPGFLADGELSPGPPEHFAKDSLDSEEERSGTAPTLGMPIEGRVPRPGGIARMATEGGMDVYSTPGAVPANPMNAAYATDNQGGNNDSAAPHSPLEPHSDAGQPSPALSDLEPPRGVTVADVEAIARQPSPARYQHGAPLSFVGEAEEEDEEEGEQARLPAQNRAAMLRPSRRALRRG